MKLTHVVLPLLLAVAMASTAAAAEPDPAVIATITGLTPDVM